MSDGTAPRPFNDAVLKAFVKEIHDVCIDYGLSIANEDDSPVVIRTFKEIDIEHLHHAIFVNETTFDLDKYRD